MKDKRYNVEIKRGDEPNSYDLFVNGEKRISNESMQLCDNVKQSLEYGQRIHDDGYPEWEELAESIRSSI